jgi:hypothetical protein
MRLVSVGQTPGYWPDQLRIPAVHHVQLTASRFLLVAHHRPWPAHLLDRPSGEPLPGPAVRPGLRPSSPGRESSTSFGWHSLWIASLGVTNKPGGPPGTPWPPGPQGPRGPQGTEGPTGPQSAQGPHGPRGSQGPRALREHGARCSFLVLCPRPGHRDPPVTTS